MSKILSALAAGTLIAAGQAMGQQPTEPPRAPTSWADKITVKGDVRFRHEMIDEEGKDVRNRERVRARIGAFAKPGSDMDVGIQLSTTEGNDPVSSNQTLGNGGSRKNAYIDLAFLDYHPESIAGLHLIGGKMEQPFIKVSDLVWDNDYNPEGIALKHKIGESVEFLLNAGAFWLEERAADDETLMYGGQAGVKFNTENASYVQAGIGLFSYDNIEGTPQLFNGTTARGNSTIADPAATGATTNRLYATGFVTPEAYAEVFVNGDVPLSLYGSYVYNDEADDEDTGYIAGIKLGKAKNPGTWEVDYNWRHLEKDAVVGQFADSDSFGGGTDGEGHKLSASYQISKTLKGTVSYFMNEKKISSTAVDYDRLQVDFSAKF